MRAAHRGRSDAASLAKLRTSPPWSVLEPLIDDQRARATAEILAMCVPRRAAAVAAAVAAATTARPRKKGPAQAGTQMTAWRLSANV